MNAWIPAIETSEARMLAAGVTIAEAIRVCTLHANAHSQEDAAIRNAHAMQAKCKQAATLCREMGSKAAGEVMGKPDRTVRWLRQKFFKSAM